MQVPLQITFRNTEKSEAVDAEIRKRVDKLNHHYPGIISCRVVVEAPMLHHQKGGLFKVRIDITLPDGKLDVNREPDARNQAHQDPYVALRDAFAAVERKIAQFSSRRKGEVKAHEEMPYGRISHLYPMEDYGLITTPDNREVYFHRNSVLNADFDALSVGAAVQFHEEDGDKGPKASSVRIE